MSMNYGDVLDAVATHRGDQLAISDDGRDISWSEFDARSNALARGLIERGIQPGDKICFLLFNGANYLELIAACFKARFVHVNANFRYLPHEIEYILDNSDSVAMVYDHRLADTVAAIDPEIRDKILLVEAGSDAVQVDNAVAYESLIEGQSSTRLDIQRSPDDLIFIYTGGTTGSPKGVMWPMKEQFAGLLGGAAATGPLPTTTEELIGRIDDPKTYVKPLIASPLMHASGLYSAIVTFCNGGHVIVTDNGKNFDAARHWQLIDQYQADAISIVGDTFAKPLLQALEEGNFDGSSVKIIGSSGVMWSTDVKRGLLKHLPKAMLFDALGSSETMGLGSSFMTAEGETQTASFKIGTHCKVLREDGTEVTPGSGEAGLIARNGPMPLGYYKDEAKTAETFQTINGVRYTIPGDYCTVDEDGTIKLLGRGSQCINTGGEKVYPQEVEDAIVAHPDVEDALVFGIPDPKWGNAVQAVVIFADGKTLEHGIIKDFLRSSLAGYKIPKTFVATRNNLRLANGKPDYPSAKAAFAEAQ